MKKFKQAFIVGLLLVTLVATSAFAKDNSSRIAEILQIIAKLKAELSLLYQRQDNTKPQCFNFDRNLGVGARGKLVADLHTVLAKAGFPVTAGAEIGTGRLDDDADNVHVYGEATAAAVVQFQRTHGILQTGFVGPITRAKLNQLYGCRPAPDDQRPQIKEVSGPTQLSVGETGTWRVRASDGERGTLNYSVDWGDQTTVMSSPDTAETRAVNQLATFTHVYRSAGIYTATFAVSDGAGLSDRETIRINVGKVPSDLPKVVSPNGGERWPERSIRTIKWEMSEITDRGAKVDLYLDPEPPACVYSVPACLVSIHPPYVLDKNINGGGSYNWIVATDINDQAIPTDNYRVRICLAGSSSACDRSDNPFSIISATSNLPPTVTGVSGPTVLLRGVIGTWTVSASDPERGLLRYSIDWGDQTSLSNRISAESAVAVQSATFTHAYAAAGVYTPTFTITDSASASAQTSISVEVG